MSVRFCEHANESPSVCSCSSDCSCKERMCRPRIVRNMSTPESRAFWESAEESSRRVAKWPCWERGIQCPGPHCCNCNPLAKHLQTLCLSLAILGWAAHFATWKPPTRWSMLEVD